MNVDRTPRNPNMLVWLGRLWLIDHGAALFLQHGVADLATVARRGFPQIADHVLLPHAAPLASVDDALTRAALALDLDALVSLVPADWVEDRTQYAAYLRGRLEAPRGFVEEAEAVRA